MAELGESAFRPDLSPKAVEEVIDRTAACYGVVRALCSVDCGDAVLVSAGREQQDVRGG